MSVIGGPRGTNVRREICFCTHVQPVATISMLGRAGEHDAAVVEYDHGVAERSFGQVRRHDDRGGGPPVGGELYATASARRGRGRRRLVSQRRRRASSDETPGGVHPPDSGGDISTDPIGEPHSVRAHRTPGGVADDRRRTPSALQK
jgi:hypothetical protein